MPANVEPKAKYWGWNYCEAIGVEAKGQTGGKHSTLGVTLSTCRDLWVYVTVVWL